MSRPTICVTLRGCSVDEMLSDAARATAVGADICEIRLDKLWVIKELPAPVEREEPKADGRRRRPVYIPPDYIPQEMDSVDLKEALAALQGGIDLPVVLTCRPIRQGGYFPGTEEERIDVLRTAIETGVSWVDLETDIDKQTRDELLTIAQGKTKVIASLHTDSEPASAVEVVEDIEELEGRGDIIKICYNTSGRNSGLKLFEAAWNMKDSGLKTAIMGLGIGGDWTRIHAPLLGQHLVYSTMETGAHLAGQGQINASDLLIAWDMLQYE